MIKIVITESKKLPDLIPGGLGAKFMGTMKQVHQKIADKHGVPLKKIEDAIKKGIKVEMEHTNSVKHAHEIAMDHVIESPNYYDKKHLEEEWSQSERSKRKSKCSNPKGFTMKQFCKNQRTKSKKGEKGN